LFKAFLDNVQVTDSRASGLKIFEQVVQGCNEMINSIDKVVTDLNDQPKFLELYDMFIKDYQASSSHYPFMPISSAIHFLRDDARSLVPIFKNGTDEFKYLYGMRGVLTGSARLTLDQVPWLARFAKTAESKWDAKSLIATGTLDQIVGGLGELFRYMYRSQVVGDMLAFIPAGVRLFRIGNASLGAVPVVNGPALSDIGSQFDIAPNIELTRTLPGNGAGANAATKAANESTSLANVGENVSDILANFGVPAPANVDLASDVERNHVVRIDNLRHMMFHKERNVLWFDDREGKEATRAGNLKFRPVLQVMPKSLIHEIIQLTQDSHQILQEQIVLKHASGADIKEDTKRDTIRIQNIITLQVVPINVHSVLQREVPFATLYNWAYCADEMLREMFHLDTTGWFAPLPLNGKDGRMVQKLQLNGKDSFNPGLKTMLALLLQPFCKVDFNTYSHAAALMFQGQINLPLGRPKFLSDQLYGKALLGSPFGMPHEETGTADAAAPIRAALDALVVRMAPRLFWRRFALWAIDSGDQETQAGGKNANGTPVNKAAELRVIATFTHAIPAAGAPNNNYNAMAGFEDAPLVKTYLKLIGQSNVRDAVLSCIRTQLNGTVASFDELYAHPSMLGFTLNIANQADAQTNYPDNITVKAPMGRENWGDLDNAELAARGADSNGGIITAANAINVVPSMFSHSQRRELPANASRTESLTYMEGGQVKEVQIATHDDYHQLQVMGKLRFDTALSRILIFVTNFYRLIRFKLMRDTTITRSLVAHGHSLIRPDLTEYVGNERYRKPEERGEAANFVEDDAHDENHDDEFSAN
jgi:hypothetical protein